MLAIQHLLGHLVTLFQLETKINQAIAGLMLGRCLRWPRRLNSVLFFSAVQFCFMAVQFCFLTIQFCFLTVQFCFLAVQFCFFDSSFCFLAVQFCFLTVQFCLFWQFSVVLLHSSVLFFHSSVLFCMVTLQRHILAWPCVSFHLWRQTRRNTEQARTIKLKQNGRTKDRICLCQHNIYHV